jgi:hypothetical protein
MARSWSVLALSSLRKGQSHNGQPGPAKPVHVMLMAVRGALA